MPRNAARLTDLFLNGFGKPAPVPLTARRATLARPPPRLPRSFPMRRPHLLAPSAALALVLAGCGRQDKAQLPGAAPARRPRSASAP